MKKGFNVKIKFKKTFAYAEHGDIEILLPNITEIHWHYPSPLNDFRVAFESDIDGTGYTYAINDIDEFEAKI